MMKLCCRIALVAAAALLAAAGQAQASTIVFNNISVLNTVFPTPGPLETSPLAAVTVSSPIDIDMIGVYSDLLEDGNLRFLIFNLGEDVNDTDNRALLFASPSQAFVDDGPSFKLSTPFAPFTLQPGITYGIGAIADVLSLWGSRQASQASVQHYTENGITSLDDRNGLAINFANPSLQDREGTAMIIIQLGTPSDVAPVPEPATLVLVGAGLAAVGLRRFRSRRRNASRSR